VAVFVNNVAPLITGIFLDRVGPKWTNIGSVLLFFLGCALFTLTNAYVTVPAYAMLGLAGPGIYCSIMHLCNLFPGHQASVLSFFSGTFSASSFIFRVFEIIYKPQRWRNLNYLFLEYIVLLIPIFIVGFFIWPNKAFQPPGKKSLVDADEEQTPLINTSDRNILVKRVSLYNVDYRKQFKSFLYWIPVFWLAFESLNISCYLGTVQTRFPKGSSMPNTFNLIWSFGWVSIPVFGVMLDNLGTSFTMNVISVCLAIFNALKLLSYEKIQYLSFGLVSTVNVGMWALFYSYLSAKFGFDNYGKLLGVSSIVTASIGALQYAFDWVTNNVYHGKFFFADVVFMVLSVICVCLSIYMWYAERPPKAKKKTIEHYPVIPSPTPTPTGDAIIN